MAERAARLTIRDLCVTLGSFRLDRLTLEVNPGEYLVILGPTGAGKTVLLETIAGLYRPRRGRVFLDGQDLTNEPPERREIGFVYQDYALFPHLTVYENIAFGLELRSEREQQYRRRIQEMSAQLGIEDFWDRKPSTLSGGEQQRVALARALVIQPRVLLLDEPLSALDPRTREKLQRELKRIHRQLGMTILHVTHDFEEAMALADRIAVIRDGQLAQIGTPDDIFQRPATPELAHFVGAHNVLSGTIAQAPDGTAIMEAEGLQLIVTSPIRGSAHAILRPEDILLSLQPLRSSARNCYRGRIAELDDRGTLVRVTVEVPPRFTAVITRRALRELNLAEGQEVWIAFKASAVHVL